MRIVVTPGIIALVFCGVAAAQRSLDWPSHGGDARRTGWERSDTRITADNVKDFRLLMKRKLEGVEGGPNSLTPPVVIGLLISYRGFKELGFVSSSAGDLWALDVDLNKVFWKQRFEGSNANAPRSGSCTGSAVMPALVPPVTFGRGRRPSAPSSTRKSDGPPRIGGVGFGASRSVFMLAPDGMLHQVNSADGSDQFSPLRFVPPGARVSYLTVNGTSIYTTTSGNCGGAQDGVWTIDLDEEQPQPQRFELGGGSANGFAIGNDGTVYVQTGPGETVPAANKWASSLLALTPKDLKLKGRFTSPGDGFKPGWEAATPLVFDYKDRDIIATAGGDGRIYLLDAAASMGGEDTMPVLAKTAPIAATGGGIRGGLTTWLDADGTRWLAAPVWGPLSEALKPAVTNGAAPHGSIVAFKLEEQAGSLVLNPAWASRDLNSPAPAVVTSGVIFALSTGGGQHRDPATLYAFDANGGKELYSTGNQIDAPGSLTGLTVSNGRVYFTTTDGTLYAFGIFMLI